MHTNKKFENGTEIIMSDMTGSLSSTSSFLFGENVFDSIRVSTEKWMATIFSRTAMVRHHVNVTTAVKVLIISIIRGNLCIFNSSTFETVKFYHYI